MAEPLSLEIVRRFPAPIGRVWAAWTHMESFRRWAVPHGFTCTFAEGEVAVGSGWRSGMRSPDGEDYIAIGQYQIVEPQTRLVFSHRWERADGSLSPETLVTVTLEEVGNETQMTFQQVGFEDPEVRDSHIGGWSESFDHLGEFIHSPVIEVGDLAAVSVDQSEQPTLVFRREFRHPQELIWAMITLKAHLERWAPFSPSRDLNSVGPVDIVMTDGDEPETYHEQVTAVAAPNVVEYTWGGDLLNWQLETVEAGTAMTLRNRVSSPEWLPRVAAGWHICLQVMDELAAGRDAPRIVGTEAKKHGWEELQTMYAERIQAVISAGN